MKTYWVKITRDCDEGGFIGFTAEMSQAQKYRLEARLAHIQSRDIDALAEFEIEEVQPKTYKALCKWLNDSLGDLWKRSITSCR